MPTLDLIPSPLPIDIRHEVYILARAIYIKRNDVTDENFFIRTGMCFAIREALLIMFPNDVEIISDPYDDMMGYPEIKQFEPTPHYSTRYWWPITDTAMRIKVFDAAIEQSK